MDGYPSSRGDPGDDAPRTDPPSGGRRVAAPRVMLEEFVEFDAEITVLTLRHFDPAGTMRTTTLSPIAHRRPGTLYHESWQPAGLDPPIVHALETIARAVTDQLGGVGLFGVEC